MLSRSEKIGRSSERLITTRVPARRRLGFRNICLTDNLVADRANFRTIYEAEANRLRHNQKLPLELKEIKQKLIEQRSGEGE